MTPLERAALAVYQVDYPGERISGLTDPASWHMEVARAVLQALREPSEAMVKAGDSCPGIMSSELMWPHMIDTALEEG